MRPVEQRRLSSAVLLVKARLIGRHECLRCGHPL